MVQSRTFKAGILISGRFLTALVGLGSFAVLSRVLSIYGYATYRQTLLAYSLVAPLLTLGLPEALYYFLPGEKERPRSILIENLLLLSFMAGLFSLFLFLGGDRLLAWRFNNPDLVQTLRILAPYSLFMLPASAFSACLVARDKVKGVVIFNVLSRLVIFATVVAAALVWRTPAAVILGTVIGAGIVLFPALKLMFASCEGGALWPSWYGMVAQLKYAVPLGLAAMLGNVSLALDKVIVSSMCAPEQFSVYANGAIEIPFISVLTGSVIAVLIPDFVKMHRSSNYEDIRTLWHKAMIRCLTILLPVMGFILIMAPEIMRLLFSDKYEGSAYPFRIYALMLPIRATTFGAVLMATNHTKAVTFGATLNLVVNALLSILFVKYIGPVGAAWATTLSTIGLALLYSYIIARCLKFHLKTIMPWKSIARVFVAVTPPTLVIMSLFYVRPENDILKLMFGLIVYLLILGICYQKLGVVRYSKVAKIIKNKLSGL
jgi:O-antigen/teichoic acid export membrane protein